MSVYQNLCDILEGGRNPKHRNIPSIRSTSVRRLDDKTVALRYHDTNVVTADSGGRVILNSGGWHTMTTKERMSEYGPCFVRQERGVWYAMFQGKEYVFEDGMVLNEKTGNVTGAGSQSDVLKLRKDVKGYVKKYIAALQAGTLGKPGLADCFMCQFSKADGSSAMGDGEHIESHIEESYLVPSLGVCVLKEQGPNGEGLGSLSKHAAYALQESLRTGEPMKAAPCESQVRRAFMKYISTRLGMVA